MIYYLGIRKKKLGIIFSLTVYLISFSFVLGVSNELWVSTVRRNKGSGGFF